MAIELRPLTVQLCSSWAISPPAITAATTLGTFFLPNTTLAAGGAAKLIAANTAGAMSVFFPACFMLTVPSLLILVGLVSKNNSIVRMGIGLNLATMMYTLILAAKAGTLATGIATGSLIFCALIGYFTALAGLALAATALVGGALTTHAMIRSCSR